MKMFLSLILAVFALTIFPAVAEDTPANPVAPATPAATTPAPVNTPAPAPTPPAAPAPAATKPDEDTAPGAFKRRLDAAKALLTGNHASLDAVEAKDKEIADLKSALADANAKLDAANKRIAAQNVELQEAVDYVQALNAGKAPANPPSDAARAAGETVSQGIAAAVRSVGIPAASLTTPPARETVPSGEAPKLTESQRSAALADYWKARGHSTTGAN